ncbi:MAG: bacterial transcriptional activator domain-containing protein [Planctomycetota bacterium]|nr:bacterial transcriptional activator domain-containing protein [Planctomycetota bacterium]
MFWKRRSAEQLWEDGVEALEACDWDEAEACGRKLEKLHFSGSFELAARAWIGRGDPERAVAVLERGIAVAPEMSRLHELLGSACSAAGRLEDALRAFDAAMQCQDVDTDSVQLSAAGVLLTHRQPKRALERVERVTGPASQPIATRLRLMGLLESGDFARCEALGNEALLKVDLSPLTPLQRSQVHSMVAWALHHQDKDRDRALKLAWEAIGIEHSNDPAAELIRILNGRRSTSTREFEIMIRADWHGEHSPDSTSSARVVGFISTYVVLADSPEEALEFIRPFEPPTARASVQIERSKDRGASPDEPKGVRSAPRGRTFIAVRKPS